MRVYSTNSFHLYEFAFSSRGNQENWGAGSFDGTNKPPLPNPSFPYAYLYAYFQINIRVCNCVYMCLDIHMNTFWKYVSIHTYISIYTYVYACVSLCIHIYMYNIRTNKGALLDFIMPLRSWHYKHINTCIYIPASTCQYRRARTA